MNEDVLLDEDGLTFEEWAEELFAYEYCEECHGDEKDHHPGYMFGHWFAFCNNPYTEEES